MKKNEALETAKAIVNFAEEKKGSDILVLDMRDVSGLCDYFVIISATSLTRGKSIGEHIAYEMKKINDPANHVEGFKDGTWIVMDFGNVVAHIYQKDIREFYALEELWGDAPRVELPKKRKKASE